MTEKHQLVAYLATLLAIVTLVGLGAILAYNGKSVEAVGVAAAVTGLIGVIKLPSQRNVTIDNPASDPVPTAEAKP
jgi:hypothetical protein